MRLALALLLTIPMSLSGCTGRQVELGDRWHPLERVVESSLWPDGRATTIGATVYLADLDAWETTYPDGPRRDGFLMHEREHALQQEQDGVVPFVARYATDPGYMWLQESRAWAIELLHLRQHGLDPNPQVVAVALSRYETLDGRPMVSREQAERWVADVLAGRWSP